MNTAHNAFKCALLCSEFSSMGMGTWELCLHELVTIEYLNIYFSCKKVMIMCPKRFALKRLLDFSSCVNRFSPDMEKI